MKRISHNIMWKFALLFIGISNGIYIAQADTPPPPGCSFDSTWKIGDPLPASCLPTGVPSLGTTSGNYQIDGVRNFLNVTITSILPLLGLVAVMFIVVNAFKMVANAGNDAKAKEGQKGVIWAAGGLLAIILSYAIITAVIRLVYQVVPGQ